MRGDLEAAWQRAAIWNVEHAAWQVEDLLAIETAKMMMMIAVAGLIAGLAVGQQNCLNLLGFHKQLHRSIHSGDAEARADR